MKQYKSYAGLEASLTIMSNYKSKAIEPERSVAFLRENEAQLNGLFHDFMPEVANYAKSHLQDLQRVSENRR